MPLTNVVVARTGDPKRGDIVTFYSPKDGTRLIKRLVAVPGDTVEMRDKIVIVGFLTVRRLYSEVMTTRELNIDRWFRARFGRLYPPLVIVTVVALVASLLLKKPGRLSAGGAH